MFGFSRMSRSLTGTCISKKRIGCSKWWNRVSRSHLSPSHIFAFNHVLFTVNLDVGIPLPKILNVNFANAALAIIEVSLPWWGK